MASEEQAGSEQGNARAWTMVGIQAVLFLAVVVAALTPPLGGTSWWSSLVLALALILLGAVGVVLAGRDLGRALTPLPIPNGEGLVARGLYRHARHPMYSALVVICVGVGVGSGTPQSWVAAALLAVFFMAKARMEERYLLSAYPGYAEYAARVGRFVPGVGRLR
jgi:protein-S-isoprenylcysteine O-methyltransferase Ste14